jgi:hypothetical protein
VRTCTENMGSAVDPIWIPGRGAARMHYDPARSKYVVRYREDGRRRTARSETPEEAEGELLGYRDVIWDGRAGRTTPQGVCTLRTDLRTAAPETVIVSLGTNDGSDAGRFASGAPRAGRRACPRRRGVARDHPRSAQGSLRGAQPRAARGGASRSPAGGSGLGSRRVAWSCPTVSTPIPRTTSTAAG